MLEIGPGTGAVTKSIVPLLQPEDRFDLVELNESFASHLQKQFERNPAYKRIASISEIHVCPLQEFETDCKYDFMISGLPLNNFSPELVSEIFEVTFRLLAPGGVLSYFEYQYIRTIKKLIVGKTDRNRLKALDAITGKYLAEHRIQRDWVFLNFPPAWVQHLAVKK